MHYRDSVVTHTPHRIIFFRLEPHQEKGVMRERTEPDWRKVELRRYGMERAGGVGGGMRRAPDEDYPS